VLVLVIVWTEIGAPPPTATPPTWILFFDAIILRMLLVAPLNRVSEGAQNFRQIAHFDPTNYESPCRPRKSQTCHVFGSFV
jgi:hypothetical protein